MGNATLCCGECGFVSLHVSVETDDRAYMWMVAQTCLVTSLHVAGAPRHGVVWEEQRSDGARCLPDKGIGGQIPSRGRK
jgi:hypothetical protein